MAETEPTTTPLEGYLLLLFAVADPLDVVVSVERR